MKVKESEALLAVRSQTQLVKSRNVLDSVTCDIRRTLSAHLLFSTPSNTFHYNSVSKTRSSAIPFLVRLSH